MKCKRLGFTLIELLTVLAIVAMLTGLLIPSLTFIRNTAKEARQKAQLTTIDMALIAFRTDYGDYPPSYLMLPPSSPGAPGPMDYCGAQKLAEALLGRDLMGFHPKSTWSATDPTFYPPSPIPAQNLDERRGTYLELGTEDAFKLGDLFGPALSATTPPLEANTFVICDSFGVKKITLAPGKTVVAGSPILYYRADPTKKQFMGAGAIVPGSLDIYNFTDNFPLIQVADSADGTPPGDHPLATFGGTYFYNQQYKIVDQKILSATGRPWPHRPDSYILISAGVDGRYGTADDICNFGN